MPHAAWSDDPAIDRQFASLIARTQPGELFSVLVMIRGEIPRAPDGVALESLQASIARAQSLFIVRFREMIGDREFEKLPAPRPIQGSNVVGLSVLGAHLPMLQALPDVRSIEPNVTVRL